MKLRTLYLLALLFLCALPVRAQFVTVTATVLDPSGAPYQNCTGSADFVPAPQATLQSTIGGGVFQTSFPLGSCDSHGAFTLYGLADNNQVQDGRPVGSQASLWKFSICSNTSPKVCFSASLTITAPSPQNISTALQAAAAPLPGTVSTTLSFLTVTSSLTSSGVSNLNGGGNLSGTFTGNPTFSGAPTFGVTPTFPSQSANNFLASPNGSSGTPTFRSLVSGDFAAAVVPVGSIAPGTNGQCHITSGGASTWGACTGTGAMQLIAPAIVLSGGNTLNAATSSAQVWPASMMCASPPCFGAGVLNTVGKVFAIEGDGNFQFNTTAQTVSIILAIDGAAYYTGNNIVGFTPASTGIGEWYSKFTCTVLNNGATGLMRCMYLLNFTDANGTSYVRNFYPGSLSVDLTAAHTFEFAVQFSTASTGNIAQIQNVFTYQYN